MSVSATLTLGVGILTVAAPSVTGGTPAAVTEGGRGADMRRASNRLTDMAPLPAAGFTTFLAACRRYLPRGQFAQVARLYYDTAEATDAWLGTYGAARDPNGGQITEEFAAALTGWLRDSAIGPAPCGPAALVRLRAVQAALFIRAIVLSWQPGALGPQPAARLPGNLTPEVAGALQTVCRTGAAAATALSVHLNQGPRVFRDASARRRRPGRVGDPLPRRPAPPYRPGASWQLDTHGLRTQKNNQEYRSWREFADAEPIRIPGHARALFAAHLSYRRASGATGTDSYFVHPREPATRSPKTACAKPSGAPPPASASTRRGCTAATANTAPISA